VASAQAPLISSPSSGTLGLDPEAALTLAWTTVQGATSYLVELSDREPFQPLPLKDARVPAQAGALGQAYRVQFADETTLQAGHKYYWRVSATVNGTLSTSAVATFTTASDPFGALARHHLSLTRAEDGVDKDKPATIAFIRQGGSAPTDQLRAEFLLGWNGRQRAVPQQGSFFITPAAFFAGKMSSDKEAEDTLAKIGGGIALDWSSKETTTEGKRVGPTRSLFQTVDVAYEGDQAFGGANLMMDYLLTFSGSGVGRFYPGAASAPAQLLVRPYLLVAIVKGDDVQTRVGPQLDVKVRHNVVARALGISGALLSVTDRWYSLSGYTRDDANYFTASMDFKVAKGFSVGYAYNRGNDAPAFKGVNRMAITAGLGFGS